MTRIICWKRGHENVFSYSAKKEEKVTRQLENMKAVCPNCRDEHGENESAFIADGKTVFFPGKIFQCSKGHVNSVSVFESGKLTVKFGNDYYDFVNTEFLLDNLEEDIDNGHLSCYHGGEDKCGCSLVAVDDYQLIIPGKHSLKTRTRLGDVWDKEGLEPVRSGGYTGKNNTYVDSKTEIANKHRLKKMQKRVIPRDKGPERSR